MSNFVFDDGMIGMIFAVHHLFVGTLADANPVILFTRINQVDNDVNWSFYLGVTATNVAIESNTYPFLLQRRTKTFCA